MAFDKDAAATTLAAASITQGEFASLVGVSRGTVNGWLTGRVPAGPHPLLKLRVERLLVGIAKATEAEALPISRGTTDYWTQVRKTIKVHMSAANG